MIPMKDYKIKNIYVHFNTHKKVEVYIVHYSILYYEIIIFNLV